MKRFIAIAVLACSLILIDTGGSTKYSKYEGQVIKKIDYTGLQTVNADELAYRTDMKTSVGDTLRSITVRNDIVNMFNYDKGLFKKIDVKIEEYQEGVALLFIFEERARISEIEFRGIGDIPESELSDIILFEAGDPLRTDFVERSARIIKNKYQDDGRFNAIVNHKIIPIDDGNAVKVQFTIDEGEEIVVRKISIMGADKVHPDMLKRIMETSEKGVFKDGSFSRYVLEQDKHKILAYYRQLGYLDVQFLDDTEDEVINYEWVDPEEKNERGIFINLKVDEGDIYYFDGYNVEILSRDGESPVFDPEELMAGFTLEDADKDEDKPVFNDTMFQQDRQMISFQYASEGYIFSRVTPRRTVDEREVEIRGEKETRKFVKIDFEIHEGSQAYIEQIIIKGNEKTKDRVIRRELVFAPGELFDARKMQISRERVFNLGFFEQVDIDVRPGSRDGYMNLIIDVTEQPTGTISLGGGYGTQAGFSIFAEVGENNLFGLGQMVSLRFEYGPMRSSVALSFRERWLFNYPISFSSSIFYNLYTLETASIFPESDQVAEYQRESFGYSLGLSYRFWFYYTIGSTWSHSYQRVINPSGNSPDSVFRLENRGFQEKRSVRLYSYRDSRDNHMNPTSGSRIGGGVRFVGGTIIGGQNHYIEYTPEASYYYSPFTLPFLESHPCVFELRASGSFITEPFSSSKIASKQDPRDNEWLGSEDRLYVGGVETLRGWEYFDYDLPRSWRHVGLYHRILTGAEFRVPIHPQMLWMAFFFDAGSLWSDPFWESHLPENLQGIVDDDLASGELYRIGDFFNQKDNLLEYFRYSYGFGFRIQIPMMPLRFWFGRKMIYDDGFKTISGYNFQFGIGDMRF